ncbi:uncharacterized protein L201_008130 [Kwoniella dendrophila CBS 6074]|uniref:Threonine/serine exporter-like N-terminal domain-containing protein n=1 Tax=Kwoniella dendrophila CBS 6074 TaxID=1295534 RepID=A0AAX4K8I0_9TREE
MPESVDTSRQGISTSQSSSSHHPSFTLTEPANPLDHALSVPTSPDLSPASSTGTSRSATPQHDPADKLTPNREVDEGDPLENPDGIEESKRQEESAKAEEDVEKLKKLEDSRRPDLLKVHWKSRLRDHHIMDMQSIQRSGSPDIDEDNKSTRQIASRLVRKHTGKPPPPSTASSETEYDSDPTNVPDSSAVSLRSTDSPDPGPRKRRSSTRRSSRSSMYDTSEDESEDDQSNRPGGVLSALLSLYREEPSGRDKGNLRSLLKGRQENEHKHHGRKRRRWSSQSLFAINSAASSVNGSRRNSMTSEVESQLGSDTEAGDSDHPRVHRSRRKNRGSLPHRSQNLEDPYIPSPHFSNVMKPAPNVSISQKIRKFMIGHGNAATWFGYSQSQDQVGTGRTQRAMAALIITSSSLAAAASPTLSHVAPAYGDDAETSKGTRRISWYEGVAEKNARQEDLDRIEDEELQGGDRNGTNLEKDMEEGRLNGGRRSKKKKRRGKRVQKELAVTKHVSNIIQRKKFIEMLAKAVVSYGAPAHSVEAWLSATADILSVEASFFYLPSVLIVAFRDSDVHSTDILFIRPSGGLELYRLSLIHEVYRKVVHDEISASQGCRVLRRIEHRTVPYSRWSLILAAAVASATASRVAFSGSFIDILMSGALGSMLAIVQFTIAQKNKLVSNIFEIAMAGILSFIARGLGASGYFCYESLASAAIVLILPGWHICLGALELGSKNVVAGAIRLVWAVVYTLFLSLGLGIGSQIWDSFGPSQPSAMASATTPMATITGSFNSNNTYWDQTFNNGTFTFANTTSSTQEATTVACYRNPDWNFWWYKEVSDWWLFLLVPMFAFSLAVWFRADCRSKDIFVMVIVACAGYVVNFYLSQQLDQTNVVSAVSAFTLGILGNLYSRLGGGSAFPSMVVGILLIVPNAIAAAGGLSSSGSSEDSSSGSSGSSSEDINAAVIVSIRMVQVGIGLAIGLFAAALVIYPFGKKRRYIFSY